MREAESVLNTALDIVSEELTEFIGDCIWIEELSVFLLEWGEQKMGGGIAEGLDPQEIEVPYGNNCVHVHCVLSLK